MSDEIKSVIIVITKYNWTKIPGDRRSTAKFICPICQTEEALYDHAIGSDGNVTPIVSCSSGCGFNAHIKLEGWK